MSNEETPQQQSGEQTQTPARQQQQGERGGVSNRHGGGGRNSSSRRFQNQSRRDSSAPQQLGQAVNMDELRELVELIAAHGFTDFELEREGFRVRLRRDLASSDASTQTGGASSVAQTPAPVSSARAAAQSSIASSPAQTSPSASGESQKTESKSATDQDLQTITSPIVGTFYRAPSPTAEPFVRAGSAVEADTVVCIIEAMKLMNEIQAETSGVIEKIYVENAQPVEYGQPLFGVRK